MDNGTVVENEAARTAWGPVARVAFEQYAPSEQRLINDDVAFRILPAPMRALATLFRIGLLRRLLSRVEDKNARGVTGGILCRKRYVEDKLTKALKGDIRSVVILGAGMDTLAYRIPKLASTKVYEVDLPQITKAKRRALHHLYGSVPDHVELVPIDFDNEDLEKILLQAGYSADRPSFFVWEGVTQYLSEDGVTGTLEFLRKASEGSQIVFTYIRKDFIEGKRMYGNDFLYNRTRVRSQLWWFGLEPNSVGVFLDRYGWSLLDHVGTAEYRERYLLPIGRDMSVMEIERAVHAKKVTE